MSQAKSDYIKLMQTVDTANDAKFTEIIKLTEIFLKLDDLALAVLLDISRPTVTRWKTGNYTPHPLMRKGIYERLIQEVSK